MKIGELNSEIESLKKKARQEKIQCGIIMCKQEDKIGMLKESLKQSKADALNFDNYIKDTEKQIDKLEKVVFVIKVFAFIVLVFLLGCLCAFDRLVGEWILGMI